MDIKTYQDYTNFLLYFILHLEICGLYTALNTFLFKIRWNSKNDCVALVIACCTTTTFTIDVLTVANPIIRHSQRYWPLMDHLLGMNWRSISLKCVKPLTTFGQTSFVLVMLIMAPVQWTVGLFTIMVQVESSGSVGIISTLMFTWS